VRLFYAAFLGVETTRTYELRAQRWIAAFPQALRGVPKGSHHLTLAFLGEVQDRDLSICSRILDQTASTPAFSLSLEVPRILYGRKAPRLICAELGRGRNRVSALQKALAAALTDRLPALRLRPKPPHVTLARFRKNAGLEEAGRIEAALAAERPAPVADRFESVQLVRSRLTPAGPVYESLGRSSLAPD